jgi:phosphoribosylanthranilate isomerase
VNCDRVRVKVCGITTVDDALMAAALGVDAIGLVFYPPSPRVVDVAMARAICQALPPFVTTVGLFVDALPDVVHATLEAVPLGCLQFHGNEEPDFCTGFGRPYLRAVRMRPGIELAPLGRQFASAQALLLDTYVEGVPGGTGQVFDWSVLPGALERPFVLAGGLTPDNVERAIRASSACAVDVSGGVEAVKGRKDRTKLMAFLQGVSRVSHRT